MLPQLTSSSTLKWLNILAVGLSIATMTSVCFAWIGSNSIGLLTGGPAFFAGIVWAWLLRRPKLVGRTQMRQGWVWSVPIAMLTSAIAGSLTTFTWGYPYAFQRLVGGFILGATFGVVCWLPMLMLVLGCFGVPIARAQSLAVKGLAGEERGERVVGVACALWSLVVFGVAFRFYADHPWEQLVFTFVTALAALVVGLTSSTLAFVRERARRQFVHRVEAGEVEGFRVDATPEGNVLVRVTSYGGAYRVSDFREELCQLDEEGHVTRASANAG